MDQSVEISIERSSKYLLILKKKARIHPRFVSIKKTRVALAAWTILLRQRRVAGSGYIHGGVWGSLASTWFL